MLLTVRDAWHKTIKLKNYHFTTTTTPTNQATKKGFEYLVFFFCMTMSTCAPNSWRIRWKLTQIEWVKSKHVFCVFMLNLICWENIFIWYYLHNRIVAVGCSRSSVHERMSNGRHRLWFFLLDTLCPYTSLHLICLFCLFYLFCCSFYVYFNRWTCSNIGNEHLCMQRNVNSRDEPNGIDSSLVDSASNTFHSTFQITLIAINWRAKLQFFFTAIETFPRTIK